MKIWNPVSMCLTITLAHYWEKYETVEPMLHERQWLHGFYETLITNILLAENVKETYLNQIPLKARCYLI